jgi:hypothetical protein
MAVQLLRRDSALVRAKGATILSAWAALVQIVGPLVALKAVSQGSRVLKRVTGCFGFRVFHGVQVL